jgi:hypothetical protein
MLQPESAQADFACVGVFSTAPSKDLSVNQTYSSNSLFPYALHGLKLRFFGEMSLLRSSALTSPKNLKF